MRGMRGMRAWKRSAVVISHSQRRRVQFARNLVQHACKTTVTVASNASAQASDPQSSSFPPPRVRLSTRFRSCPRGVVVPLMGSGALHMTSSKGTERRDGDRDHDAGEEELIWSGSSGKDDDDKEDEKEQENDDQGRTAYAERVRQNALAMMEQMRERPEAVVFVSNARDPGRDRGASRTGVRMVEVARHFDVIDWPLYDDCPHDEQSRCPHPLWRRQLVRSVLSTSSAYEVLAQRKAVGKLFVMGKWALVTLAFPRRAGLSKAELGACYIPHAERWNKRVRRIELHGRLCAAIPEFWDQATFVDFLARTQHGQKLRAHCATLGRLHGGPKQPTPKSRAASSATGKLAGRLRPSVSVRMKMAGRQRTYLATEKGRAEQKAKGAHMASARDEKATQEAATAARRKRWEAVSIARTITKEACEAAIAEGWDKARLAREHQLTYKEINDRLSTYGLKIPQKSQRNLQRIDDDTEADIHKAYALGFCPERINHILSVPVAPEDINFVVFPKVLSPNDKKNKNPSRVISLRMVRDTTKPDWKVPDRAPVADFDSATWLSPQDVLWLVGKMSLERLSLEMVRMWPRKAKTHHLALWASFLMSRSRGDSWCGQLKTPYAFEPSPMLVRQICEGEDPDKDAGSANVDARVELSRHTLGRKRARLGAEAALAAATSAPVSEPRLP
jgi:hypothetical protein